MAGQGLFVNLPMAADPEGLDVQDENNHSERPDAKYLVYKMNYAYFCPVYKINRHGQEHPPHSTCGQPDRGLTVCGYTEGFQI